MSLYLWECILVKDYARIGTPNVAANWTALAFAPQEAAHESVGEGCNSADTQPVLCQATGIPNPGDRQLLILYT
jgi:hypothetical protein